MAGRPLVLANTPSGSPRPDNSPEMTLSSTCALVSPATWRTIPNNSPNTPRRSLSRPSNSASFNSFSEKSFSKRSERASSRLMAFCVRVSNDFCWLRFLRNSASRAANSALSLTRPWRTWSSNCCSVTASASATGVAFCACAGAAISRPKARAVPKILFFICIIIFGSLIGRPEPE